MEYYGAPQPLPNGSFNQIMAITDWVKSNPNFTQWIFNVKPGLKWSDGTNFTSADILYTFGPNYLFNASYDFLGMGKEVAKEFALNSSAAEYRSKHT